MQAKPSIMNIAPYVGGESKASPASGRVIKLSSNEGAFGVPKGVKEAIQRYADTAHRYPDGGCIELRSALGLKYGIDPAHIVCGAGSDEIISFLCQAYVSPRDEVIYSRHGFLMYPISTQVAGGIPVPVPEQELRADLQAMLSAVTDKTKIIFLANPNNPTGSYLNSAELRAFLMSLPKHILLVLDSAYAEFVTAPDYSAGHEFVSDFGNVVVTRTFSKIYGMGGVRLGWGHCPPDIADVLNRVRGPFNVSSLAQVCGIAALGEAQFIADSQAHNTFWRERASEALTQAGLRVYPSQGNFLLVSFGTAEKAESCRLALKDQGIILRQMGAYGLSECLRISIGHPEEMEIAISTLTAYMNNS